LKSINNDVFNYLSEECIKSLKIENIQSLVEIEKVEFLPDFVLNKINKELFKDIPDNFYGKIQSNHIEKANKDILKHIITLKKLNLLNSKSFESFCKIISFKDLEKENVFSVLDELQKRNKFKYIFYK
jgi:predicted nuclease of restriction endonuclease-like RecB superfamily